MHVQRTTRRFAAVIAFGALSACGGGKDADPAALTVGGTVVGLSGTLVLADDLGGGAELTLTADGPFTLPGSRASGSRYAVRVKQAPGTQRCAVTDGEGTVGGAPVRDVSVTCSSSKFFAGSVGGTYRLWRTDGTAAGTAKVTDSGAGEPALALVPDLQPDRGVILFAANDGTSGYELWRSDGTAAGTALVKDANASGNGVLAPLGGVVWRGRRWYAGTDGTHGFEPWSSDGTAAGTAMLLDVSDDATSSRPDGFAVAGDALYFAATHPLSGRELWRTRGTAETTELVQDLAYGATGSSPSWLTPVDGALFFVASTDQLWVADAGGVRMLRDFGVLGSPDAPANLVAFAGKLYFTAKHPDAGVELWSSDGTAEGTAVVKDVNPSGGSFPSGLAVANGALWFAADDGAHGREPWSSDGTPDGTDLVADVSTTAGASSSPSGFVAAGGAVFFAADDGNDGVELWKATAGGAELVLDIAFDPPGEAPVGSSPRYLSALGDALLFSAWQLGAGAELWRSDGTAGGTALVWEIDPGDGWGY